MFSILVQCAAWGENGDSPHKWGSPAHGLMGKPSVAQNSVSAEEHFAGLGVWYEQKTKKPLLQVNWGMSGSYWTSEWFICTLQFVLIAKLWRCGVGNKGKIV